MKNVRITFNTTPERALWLQQTAKYQEISVSQLINRLIRYRVEKSTKQENKNPEETPSETLDRAELLRLLAEDD